jgi:hypothetical protein
MWNLDMSGHNTSRSTDGDGEKVVRLALTRADHHRFRLAAARHDTSMSRLATRITREFIDTDEAKDREGRKR